MLKHFENGLKSMQIFQRLMEGMNHRERLYLNQMSSAVRSDLLVQFAEEIKIV
jgi:hypothetical protein